MGKSDNFVKYSGDSHLEKDMVVYGFVSKDYEHTCKPMKRTFNQLAGKYSNNATFFEVDADKFQSMARKYEVDTYPTYVLLNGKDNKKEVGRVSGMYPENLRNCINRAMTA